MKQNQPGNQHTCVCAQSCPTLCNPMDCSLSGSSIHEIFPGKSAGLDCHFLLQGIFPTQESNLGLPHCRQTLYRLSHQGLKQILIVVQTKAIHKAKCICVCVVDSVMSDSSWLYGLQLTRLLCPWHSPGKNIGVGLPFPSPGDLPYPRIEPGSPALQVDSLLFEPGGKPLA